MVLRRTHVLEGVVYPIAASFVNRVDQRKELHAATEVDGNNRIFGENDGVAHSAIFSR